MHRHCVCDDAIILCNVNWKIVGPKVIPFKSLILGKHEKLVRRSHLKLNNILHCPIAAANLLSIHKFCVDNKCWFILTDSHFFVKDNFTGQTLLQGQSRDGLYPIFLSKSTNKVRKFAAFLGVSTSSKI
jgi:hypothetical protein